LGATGRPPFKQVLTHGFVVKPDGTKVSKSDKEYVTATQEVNRHGADVLRLWCCSMDYQNDIPTSPAAIQEFGDKYRKIRNTLKFLLGNVFDFDPKKDSQEIPQRSLDGWANWQTDQLILKVTEAYEAYQLHWVFRLLHDFCAVQVSTIYSTAMKDRLYCELPNSPIRRRCQTVMYRMASVLTRLLAPMLVFTADEAWEHLPHKNAEDWNVHLTLWPEAQAGEPLDEWKTLMELRDQANAQLDKLKKEAGMNKALDAELVFHIPIGQTSTEWETAYSADLEDLAGAGSHGFAEAPVGEAIRVEVLDRREKYKACARSWKRRPDVGQDAEYPDLSLRDAEAVRASSAARS
jgi:isoleucyl-tRNA synthetase